MKNTLHKMVTNKVFAVMSGNAAASILGLVTFTLLARHLETADFGRWVLFTATISLLDLIRTGLVRSGFIRQYTLASEYEKKQLVGTTWLLMLGLSFALASTVYAVKMALPSLPKATNLELFFECYPAYAMLSAPYYLMVWWLQAEQKFISSNFPRLLLNALMVLTVLAGHFVGLSLANLCALFALFHGIAGIWTMTQFGSGFRSIPYVSAHSLRSLWTFGRNSLATLAGSSLLRSTDIYLIGMYLGPEAVAIYSIPLKLIDLLDIPLRSFATAEFPRLTSFFHESKKQKFSQKLHALITRGTLISVTVVALMLLFSGLVFSVFKVTDHVLGIQLMAIFSAAMLILPSEKMLGTAFDAVGRPDRNAMKVWAMLAFNVIGDLWVLTYFPSLQMVAMVTILNQALGVYYSTRFFQLSIKSCIHEMRIVYGSIIKWSPISVRR